MALNDLLLVGPAKPMGYLPLSKLKKLRFLRAAIQDCEIKGFRYKKYLPGECFALNGALYVWDESSLQKLLKKHRRLLKKNNIPVIANEFVDYIARNIVPMSERNCYRVVGLAFGDKRFVRGASAHAWAHLRAQEVITY